MSCQLDRHVGPVVEQGRLDDKELAEQSDYNDYGQISWSIEQEHGHLHEREGSLATYGMAQSWVKVRSSGKQPRMAQAGCV